MLMNAISLSRMRQFSLLTKNQGNWALLEGILNYPTSILFCGQNFIFSEFL